MFDWKTEFTRKGHRVVLSGQPITMHCHHYNINLQQTLEKRLGETGVELMFRSAEEASYFGFRSLLYQYTQIKTLKSKLEMAALLFQNSGLGVLRFGAVGPEGGQVFSPSNHHVTGWLAKLGRRRTPGCHFIRGWLAGVLEAIFETDLGHFAVREPRCKMMRDPECHFEVSVREGHLPPAATHPEEPSRPWP